MKQVGRLSTIPPKKTGKKRPQRKVSSQEERDLTDFVRSIMRNTKVMTNVRDVLRSGYELDIYIPSKKVAFEFNGLYWHDEDHKKPDYHLKKTEECRKTGIKLIQIFEDEWIFDNEIVKNWIKQVLGVPIKPYSIESSVIRASNISSAVKFINGNSLFKPNGGDFACEISQKGKTYASLVLKKEDKGVGRYKIEGFAEKLGFSNENSLKTLLDFFIEMEKPSEIVSESDKRWCFYDKQFINSGMKREKDAPPKYYIVEGNTRLTPLSEGEVGKRIYDCGNEKFRKIMRK